LFAVLLLTLFATPALAHHGKDFLLLESDELPHPHSLFLITSDAVTRAAGSTSYEGEPALLYGVSERIAAELHAHIAKAGSESFRVEAISPSIHISFPQRSPATKWRFGLSAEYEIARGEEEDTFETRLIAVRRLDDAAFGINLIGSRHTHGPSRAGYAIGFRTKLEDRVGWGVEAQGELVHRGSREALAGIYVELTPRISMKIGAGAARGEEGTSAIVRSSFIIHF
jgi:hypothetical protein